MFSFFKKKNTAKKEHQSNFVRRDDYQYVHDKFINFCEIEEQTINKRVVTEIKNRIKKADNSGTATGKSKLNFKKCNLIDPEICLLIQVLASKPVIAKLDLRGNKITDLGGDSIIELLEAQCKIVRNVNVRDRKHILFVEEVLLNGNKISLTAIKRINLLCESLCHANAVAHIYKIYNQLKEPIFIEYDTVVKIWSAVVASPRKSEIDKAFAFANVIDFSHLTYCDMEAGILEGLRLKGIIYKLNARQMEDISVDPDSDNDILKGKIEPIPYITTDDFEDNGMRQLSVSNSFENEQPESSKKMNSVQVNKTNNSIKAVDGSVFINNKDSIDDECKLNGSEELYTVEQNYNNNKMDSNSPIYDESVESVKIPTRSNSPSRISSEFNSRPSSGKRSANANDPLPLERNSSSKEFFGSSPFLQLSRNNSNKSISRGDSKTNIVSEYDENILETSVPVIIPQQKVNEIQRKTSESQINKSRLLDSDDEPVNQNEQTSPVNKNLFLNSSYQSVDSEPKTFNDLVNKYTPNGALNTRKEEINSNNNKLLSLIKSKNKDKESTSNQNSKKFNNRYNAENMEDSVNNSAIVVNPELSSQASYNDGYNSTTRFDDISIKVQQDTLVDSDDDLPNIRSNVPSAIKVRRDVLPDSEDEQTNNMLSKFSNSFSQLKEVDSDDDYSPSGTKMISNKKPNSMKKILKSPPGSKQKSSTKKVKSIADKIKSPSIFSPTGEPPNGTVEDLLAKLKSKGSNQKASAVKNISEPENACSTTITSAPATILKSVPSYNSTTAIPVTPLFHFDSIYKSSSNEEEESVIPHVTRSSSVENPIFSRIQKSKYVQPEMKPDEDDREMRIFDDKDIDEIQASITSNSIKNSFQMHSRQQVMDETLTEAVINRNLLTSIKKKVENIPSTDQKSYSPIHSSPLKKSSTDDTTDNDELTSSSNNQESRRKGSKPTITIRSDFIMNPSEMKQNSYSCLDLADKKLRDGFDFSLFISPQKYGSLKVLILRNNEIEDLNELLIGDRFTRLIELDLAYNYISCKTFDLPYTLLRLDLSYNDISDTAGFMVCISLQELNLSFNNIRKVDGFPATLKRLDLSNNCISSSLNLRLLSLSPELESLNLANNPITEKDSQWKLKLKSFLPKLIFIDGIVVNQRLAQKQKEEEIKQQTKKPFIPREVQESNDMKRATKKKLSQEEIDKDLNKLVESIRRQKTISPSKVNALAERLSKVSPRKKAVNSKSDNLERIPSKSNLLKKRSGSPGSLDNSIASSLSRSTSPSIRVARSIEPLKRSNGNKSSSEQISKRLAVPRTESLFNSSVLESVDLEEFNYNVREFDEDIESNKKSCSSSIILEPKESNEVKNIPNSKLGFPNNETKVDSITKELAVSSNKTLVNGNNIEKTNNKDVEDELSAKDRFLAKIKKFSSVSDQNPKSPVAITSQSMRSASKKSGDEKNNNVNLTLDSLTNKASDDQSKDSTIVVKRSLSGGSFVSNDGNSSKLDSLSQKLSQIEEMTKSNFTELEEVTKLAPQSSTSRNTRTKSISSTTTITTEIFDNNEVLSIVDKCEVNTSHETKQSDTNEIITNKIYDEVKVKLTDHNNNDNYNNNNNKFVENQLKEATNLAENSMVEVITFATAINNSEPLVALDEPTIKITTNDDDNYKNNIIILPKEDKNIQIIKEADQTQLKLEEKKEEVVVDKSKLSAKERLLLRMSSNKVNKAE